MKTVCIKVSRDLRSRTRQFIVATILLALITPFSAIARAIDQTDAPDFISSIGRVDTSAPNGAFSDPSSIATDNSNNVYVVDSGNDRVQKFSASGTYITQWGTSGSGDGQFDNPYGIATDANNNVYVTDQGNGRIQKFTPNGGYITQWGEYDGSIEMDGLGVTSQSAEDMLFKSIQGITVAADGSVYAADSANNLVKKFTANGDFVINIGIADLGEGQLYSPHDVATDSSNNVYVADTGNNRVQKFSSSGTYISQWGSQGSNESEFEYPTAIAIDQDSNVYVTDTGNNRIQKFDSSGDFMTGWGEYGGSVQPKSVPGDVSVQDMDDGKFDGPLGLTVAVNGNAYVVDAYNSRIQSFSGTGTFVTKWGEYGAGSESGSGNGEFDNPESAAVDSSGNLYVADTYNHRIQKFSSSGTYITQWGSQGSGDGQFSYPSGIAVDSSGNVFVADGDNNRIQKFSSTGAYITQWGESGIGNSQFYYPIDITIDSGGNVYVSDHDNNRIQKFSSTGAYITQWGTAGSGNSEFNGPSGIAVDSSYNVYVADTNNNRIQKFSSTGAYITQWGEESLGGGIVDSVVRKVSGTTSMAIDEGKFKYPRGITIDDSNNVYVADTGNGRIQKFTEDGAYLTTWGTKGGSVTVPAYATASLDGSESELNYPSGVVADKNGNVYVVDSGNHRIQKFGYVQRVELTQPGSIKKVVLQTPSDITVNSSKVVTQQSIREKDADNQYPLGLVDFNLSVPAGSTQQISLTFETDLKPSEVVARKYHAAKNSYSNLPGAEIIETTVDGRHALELTYSITDGGNLDDDGAVNGIIVDPVGLAVGAGAPGAPNSGAGTVLHWAMLPIFVLAMGLVRAAYVRGLPGRRNTTV